MLPDNYRNCTGTTLTNTECGECPDRTFSENYFSAFCKPHTDCQSLVLQEITAGTNTSDSECGPRNYPRSRVAGFVPAVLVVLLLTVILGKIMKSEHNRQREQQNEDWRRPDIPDTDVKAVDYPAARQRGLQERNIHRQSPDNNNKFLP
ncbi:hypothetical protein COCON_G00236110 [Conger conger]|uniref:Uncharacterized protein n=1 Tax=Conger conger TaxID=82655 RepID=A0A9Q1CTH6_CONCO|nr:hypothetical protein COCON_G00236110 [Conger conger]